VVAIAPPALTFTFSAIAYLFRIENYNYFVSRSIVFPRPMPPVAADTLLTVVDRPAN